MWAMEVKLMSGTNGWVGSLNGVRVSHQVVARNNKKECVAENVCKQIIMEVDAEWFICNESEVFSITALIDAIKCFMSPKGT